jgi:hypothetical protein
VRGHAAELAAVEQLLEELLRGSEPLEALPVLALGKYGR